MWILCCRLSVCSLRSFHARSFARFSVTVSAVIVAECPQPHGQAGCKEAVPPASLLDSTPLPSLFVCRFDYGIYFIQPEAIGRSISSHINVFVLFPQYTGKYTESEEVRFLLLLVIPFKDSDFLQDLVPRLQTDAEVLVVLKKRLLPSVTCSRIKWCWCL